MTNDPALTPKERNAIGFRRVVNRRRALYTPLITGADLVHIKLNSNAIPYVVTSSGKRITAGEVVGKLADLSMSPITTCLALGITVAQAKECLTLSYELDGEPASHKIMW